MKTEPQSARLVPTPIRNPIPIQFRASRLDAATPGQIYEE